MLVSKTNFRLAAVDCMTEFATFAHFFGLYEKAAERKEAYENGVATFSVVEFEDPKAVLQKRYEQAAKAAIDKLFVLNHKYHKKNGENIVCYLENFADYIKALDEIEAFLMAN